jgi:hypothetical protein
MQPQKTHSAPHTLRRCIGIEMDLKIKLVGGNVTLFEPCYFENLEYSNW